MKESRGISQIPMGAWKATGLMAILLGIAFVLKFGLSPIQETLVPLTSYSSLSDPSQKSAEALLSLPGSSFIRVLNYTNDWELAFETTKAVLREAQKRKEPIQTLLVPTSLPGPWVLPDDLKSTVVRPVKMELGDVGEFYKAVSSGLLSLGRTLIFSPALLGSHRMGANLMTFMEERFGLKIPALSITALALNREDERLLAPPCEFSASDNGAHVLDLGCLSLKVSRYDQLQQFDPQRTYFHLERIDAYELLLTLQAPSDRISMKGTSFETLKRTADY